MDEGVVTPGKGVAEERFAEQYLRSRGLTLKQRNYRCRFGEIDLIMLSKSTLVFVEVRQRKHNRYGSAAESVTYHKQNKLRKAAEHYLMEKPQANYAALRFDVIAITGQLPHAEIEWVENAF